MYQTTSLVAAFVRCDSYIFQPGICHNYRVPAIVAAVLYDQRETVRLLVSLGAKLDVTSERLSPLMFAVRIKNAAMVDELLQLGAKAYPASYLLAVNLCCPDVLSALLKTRPGRTAIQNRVVALATSAAITMYNSRIGGKGKVPPRELKVHASMISELLSKADEINSRQELFRPDLTNIFRTETVFRPMDLQVTKLAMQHGCCIFRADVRLLLDVPCLRRPMLYPTQPEAATEPFLRLLLLVQPGARARHEIRRRIACREWHGMAEDTAARLFLSMLSTPLTLQDLCIVSIRRCFRGRLWEHIDTLPVPMLLKNRLKLVDYD